jgi:hypothetical protein
MKKLRVVFIVVFCVCIAAVTAVAWENGTITYDDTPVTAEPNFFSDITGTLMKGDRVAVISRTSWTDTLAALPVDYWYVVEYWGPNGEYVFGYTFGSNLAVDAGADVPIKEDPEGFVPPMQPSHYSHGVGEFCIRVEIDLSCRTTPVEFSIPEGKKGVNFEIKHLSSSWQSCMGEGITSVFNATIADIGEMPRNVYTYTERIADDPGTIEMNRADFSNLVLPAGSYGVSLNGGYDTVCEICYEVIDK